jgi:hypothetical protein
MLDLEEFAFDQLRQLLPGAVDPPLGTFTLSFLEQQKIKSRVENATAEFAGSLLRMLAQEKIPPEQQQVLIGTCVRELAPVSRPPASGSPDGQETFEALYRQTGLPPAILENRLDPLYAFVFPRVADFLFQMLAALNQADAEGRLETLTGQIQAVFAPREASVAPAREAPQPTAGDISFDIPLFPEAGPAPEEVSFTTLYPREVGVETWNTLLVYAHLSSALESIRADAERFKDQLLAPKEVTVPASTPLVRGTEITMVPHCEGVTFNPQRISLAWLEDFHRADFRFRADKSLAEDAAKGSIDLYVGPLIVGTLKLAFLVSATLPPNPLPQEEHGTMYHQDDIFISYSHKDTDIVAGFKKAYEAIGNNVLIDVETLRSGQDWNAELLKMIERAEIFQLFWSENSSQSKYCQQEWEYALKLNKGAGFIRPCYWQVPLVPPPDELGSLHFEFVQI